ncbi:MAG: DUF4097 family beta strand repeat-containing protein [Candidatus Eiseniibacteriota bacterium]
MRIAPLISALSLSIVLAAPAFADEWNRSFPVSGTAALSVESNDGRVTITSWDKPEIAIHVTSSGWKLDSQVALDAVKTGSRVDLTARVPNTIEFFMFTNHWLHIEVSVPRHTDVEARTSDGAVTLERIEGTVHAKSGDGHIEATDLKGDIELRTGDGGIEARGLDGRLTASSGDGRIQVSGRFDALDLSSGDGHITAEAARGSLISEGWDLDTSDGGITLRIPAELKANLSASTSDGGISVDVPVEVSGDWHAEHHLHGTLNGGGAPLRLRSGDGSIRIERL